MEQNPRVGIGVMVIKDGKILLGKRKGSHGSGEYAFPGGHLEYMESFRECAEREVMEETGMRIGNIRFQYLGNIKTYAPKHYVHIALVSDWVEGEPVVCEPEKVESWGWYAPDALPQPLFSPCVLQVKAYMENEFGAYFDA